MLSRDEAALVLEAEIIRCACRLAQNDRPPKEVFFTDPYTGVAQTNATTHLYPRLCLFARVFLCECQVV